MSKKLAVLAGAFVLAACKFPYPADVKDEDATSSTRSVGGNVSGLWTGGAITLHLAAGDVIEDIAARAGEPFTFAKRLDDGATYVVTVLDDGPDHDCTVTNGNGSVNGADVSDLAVSCTNLIPHGIAVSAPVALTFDPGVTSYPLAVSVLQQEVTVVVTGPSLTSATVAGQAVTVGQRSAPVALGQGQTTVTVVVTKGTLSRRYDLVFDRGAAHVAEALYGRASNGGSADEFGHAVAVAGDAAAIGAPGEDSSTELGNDNATSAAGAVYVFRRAGLAWSEAQILKGSAISANRSFGASVAMAGDVLVVGAPDDNARAAQAGAVHVFRLDPGTGRWREEQRITASDAHAGDAFGAVAISGDRIAIGAPRHDRGSPRVNDDLGLVYVYHWNGTAWAEEGRISPPSSAAGDGFGSTLVLDGDTLAVVDRFGAAPARVYRRAGVSWNPEVVPVDAYGRSIDLDGDLLVVGQPGDASGNGLPGDQSAPDSGAVRVFGRAGTVWSQVAYLKASTPQEGAQIGTAVAVHGSAIVTTSPTFGAVQTFHRVGANWLADPTVGGSGPPTSTTFGYAVAMTASAAVVGSLFDDGPPGGAPASGTAWFFR